MNRDRRVRRHLLAHAQQAWVYPSPGGGDALLEELRSLLATLETPTRRAPELDSLRGAIHLRGADYRTLLELTLRVTCAQDLTIVIARGRVYNRSDLEALLEGVHWEFFFREGDVASLQVDSRASALYHEGLVRSLVSDHLLRRGIRLEPATHAGGLQRLRLRLLHDTARLELSLAGRPIWQRGYRGVMQAVAPLREDLAQTAVRLSLADGSPTDGHERTLFVPFAGSGTFLFEYLIARFAIPPFVFRRDYAFEQFACGVPPSVGWLENRLIEELRLRFEAAGRICARLVDRSAGACDTVAANHQIFAARIAEATSARGRRLEPQLDLECVTADVFARPWRKWLPEATHAVFLPLNPPYGLRLTTRSTEGFYRRVGSACRGLSEALPPGGLRGFVLCPSEASWRSFRRALGRVATTTTHLSQGGRDVRLCRFRS